MATLKADGLQPHCFGMKMRGLELSAAQIVSADSLAWSYAASRRPAMEGCEHASCQNCLK
jgi:hypothetical protein